MIWLTKIKAYWSILVGLLVGGLAVAVKVLAGSNRRLRKEKNESEAQVDNILDTLEKDKEIERQRKSRSAEIKNDIDKARDSLRNPDDWD